MPEQNNTAYILTSSPNGEVVGVYTSLKRAKHATMNYVDQLESGDPDAFDELIAYADKPFIFKIKATPINEAPAETIEDLLTNINTVIAKVTYDQDEHRINIHYEDQAIPDYLSGHNLSIEKHTPVQTENVQNISFDDLSNATDEIDGTYYTLIGNNWGTTEFKGNREDLINYIKNHVTKTEW